MTTRKRINNHVREGSRLATAIIYSLAFLVILICVYPMYYVFINSISEKSAVLAMQVNYLPVGFSLDAYKTLAQNAEIWRALRNTLVTSLWNIAINFPLPIVFAVILNECRAKAFKKFVQTISYMPRFISTVVVVAILGEMLSPSSGLLNRFLGGLGIAPIYFMNLPEWFRPIFVLSDSWQFTGWTAIIYLAAITSINSDLFEAAEIDGAGRLQRIWHVTIPSIMPTVMVMLILQIGHMLTLGYEKVLLLYTPANSAVSDILDTLVYRTGLSGGTPNYSYATAIGLFSGVVGLILVSSANRISRKVTGESIY